jgi:hypothetical protein
MKEGAMSETRSASTGGQPGWTVDTPVGRAMVVQEAIEGKWVAQLDVGTTTRQSQPLDSRDEAEAWIEQEVVAAQRESDVAPVVETPSTESTESSESE